MASRTVIRLRIISGLVLLLIAVLLTRLFYLQVIRSQHYRDLADHQYLRPAAGLFDRGNIYFSNRDGSPVAAATTKEGYTVAINPKLITNATSTYDQLEFLFASTTPLDFSVFMSKASKADDPYEEIADQTDQNLANQILALNLKGVTVAKERWRYYPASTTAAHVIGLMGYNGDDYTGRYGLEKEYNETLSRTDDESFSTFFAEIFRGLQIGSSTEQTKGDLVLTIEPTVQGYLESILAKTKEKYQAELIGGIVMDPQTGAIVAMSALPNFNPGQRQSDLSILNNPLIEGRYEMGSIVKALTVAAGLDSGAVTAKTTYNDTGCLTLNTKRICNYDGKARGVIPVQEVLNQSLNVGATFVEQQIGKDRFLSYLKNYGLDQKTGIDLPGEISGSLASLNTKQDIGFATASFGQGISLTPIEITRALATLANGGYLVKPYVVKEIKYTTGLKSVTVPVIGPQVLSTSTSKEISRMLTVVVDEKLANGKAKLDHLSIAAKTGTAQYVDPETKEYYPDRYLHSFFGYFPATNSKFLVFMFIKHPLGVQYASETLTAPFMEMAKFLISYYNLPPDR